MSQQSEKANSQRNLYLLIAFLLVITFCLVLAVVWLVGIGKEQSGIINRNEEQDANSFSRAFYMLNHQNNDLQRTIDAKDATIQSFIGTFTPTWTFVPGTPTPPDYCECATFFINGGTEEQPK